VVPLPEPAMSSPLGGGASAGAVAAGMEAAQLALGQAAGLAFMVGCRAFTPG
jgi:hypothetical protein